MDDYWFAKADGLLWRSISQLVPLGTGKEREFSLPSMVPYAKVKVKLLFWGIGQKLTSKNSELFQAIPCVIEKFQLIVFAL